MFMAVRSHGDDSASATQLILVFDGDDASFFLVFSIQTQTTRIVFFTVTGPRAWHGHKQHIHLETAIRVERFIAV